MAPAKPPARRPPRVAFPKKTRAPRADEFAALLPLASGRRFEATRAFLRRQKGVAEEIFFYGPRTGWAFRYLRGAKSLCTVMIHEGRPIGILSLAGAALEGIDWKDLSPVGQRARRHAHGSPSQLWLDVPLDGTGAGDFRSLVKAKLLALPPPAPAPKPPAQG